LPLDAVIARDLWRRLALVQDTLALAVRSGAPDDLEHARREAEVLAWELRLAVAVVIGEVAE
jgi:hypothetical protein